MWLRLHQDNIAGLGQGLPLAQCCGYDWNGSAWTLLYEFKGYILIGVLGLFGMFGYRWIASLAFVLMLLLNTLTFLSVQRQHRHPGPADAGLLQHHAADPVLLRHDVRPLGRQDPDRRPAGRRRRRRSRSSPTSSPPAGTSTGSSPSCTSSCGRAVRLPLQNWERFGDLSYGIYIYAWPIQQFVAFFDVYKLGWVGYHLVIVVVCHIAAFLSWHLLEKPALSLKNWTPHWMAALIARGDRSPADQTRPSSTRSTPPPISRRCCGTTPRRWPPSAGPTIWSRTRSTTGSSTTSVTATSRRRPAAAPAGDAALADAGRRHDAGPQRPMPDGPAVDTGRRSGNSRLVALRRVRWLRGVALVLAAVLVASAPGCSRRSIATGTDPRPRPATGRPAHPPPPRWLPIRARPAPVAATDHAAWHPDPDRRAGQHLPRTHPDQGSRTPAWRWRAGTARSSWATRSRPTSRRRWAAGIYSREEVQLTVDAVNPATPGSPNRGIASEFVVVPAKWSVYPDKMPDWTDGQVLPHILDQLISADRGVVPGPAAGPHCGTGDRRHLSAAEQPLDPVRRVRWVTAG